MEIFKKILILALIVTSISGFLFMATRANAAEAVLYQLKEFILKPLIRVLANMLENSIVNKMSSLITGQANPKNQPNFITNWRNYTLDSMARGNDVFRAELKDSNICPYFSNNLQKTFGADLMEAGALAASNTKNSSGVVVYSNELNAPGEASFKTISNCTISANIDVSKFSKDFNQGGWDAWNQLIQPQNNFIGAYIEASEEQDSQKTIDTQASLNSAIAGNGFLGKKIDKNPQDPSKPTGPSGCSGSSTKTNRCLFVGKEVTPGSLIDKVSESSIGAKISRAGFGTEITDVIQGLIGAVVTGLTSKVGSYIGQSNYDAIITGAGNAINGTPEPGFDETGKDANGNPISQDSAESNAKQAQNGSCTKACSADYNSCIANDSANGQSGSSTASSSSGTNTSGKSVCSQNLSACDAQCPKSQ